MGWTMKRRTRWITIGLLAIIAMAGAIGYAMTTAAGFHPFLGKAEIDTIATLVLRQEILVDAPTTTEKWFIDTFGVEPTSTVLAQFPGAQTMSAFPQNPGDSKVCSISQLISLSPLTTRASVSTFTGIVTRMNDGPGLFGGGLSRYHLIRNGSQWRIDRVERLESY
jgi:hypothetical protein